MEKELRNKGYSLVELIVVVMIIAILAGGTTIGVNIVHNARAEQAAKKLASEISYARQLTMTAAEHAGVSSVTLRIYAYEDDYYAEVQRAGAVEDKVMLGNSRLTIKAGPKASTADNCPYTVSEGSELELVFDKNTGGLVKTTPGGDGAGKCLDLYVIGMETHHVLIAEYTGRTFTEQIE